MSLESVLRGIAKFSTVLISIPATWAVAGSLYTNPIERLIVQIAAVAALETTLLLGWHMLDTSRGKATTGQMTLYAALAIVGYIGINVVAVQNGESASGLVYRAAVGVMIVYSIAEAGLFANIRLNAAADRDVMSHAAVKRHARTAAIRYTKAAIDSEYAVKLASLQANQGVTLEALSRQTARQLAAVRVEHRHGLEDIAKASQVSRTVESDGFPLPIDKARAVRSDNSRRISETILSAARDNPYASLQDLATAANVSRETARRHLSRLKSAGRVHVNGHGIEVLAR